MGSNILHRLAYRRFCKQLRRWRIESGQTQRALAVKLHKPPSYVHKTEVGERRIDPLEFISWCHGCERDPALSLRQIRDD
jgi:hypothetical protein